MFNNTLQIKGRSLVLKDQQPGRSRKDKPRKSKRQLFNRDFFKNEETHEIANHYKDFQRRRKIRKRRRKSSVKFVKGFEERISYREVLQIPCFIFPRFSEVFPWRGRQTICELNPPDTIYNNTIKRITFADTLKELHTLATRQTFLYKNSLNRHKQQQQQNSINIKRGQPTIRSLTTNPISTTFLQFTKNIQELDPEREKQKPTLGCVRRRRREEEILSTIIKPYKNSTTTIVKLCTDDELIQLASECYDEGFQSHWEYLKSIGERNALKRCRKHSTCSAASSCRSLSSSNSAESSGKYIPSLKRIVQIKQRPTIKRSRRIYIRNHDDDLYSHTDCQIRIDITRSPSAADSHTDKSDELSDYNNSSKNHKNIQHHCDSMSDFLFNDNLLASNKLPSVNGGSNFNPINKRNVTELIDSLCGLQISDTGSLPKIILTDFSSTASHDTNIAGQSTSISALQSISSGCHKHQNFKYHEFDRTLGIPDEKNYRSEARPP